MERNGKKDKKDSKRVAYPDGVFPKGVSAEKYHANRVGR